MYKKISFFQTFPQREQSPISEPHRRTAKEIGKKKTTIEKTSRRLLPADLTLCRQETCMPKWTKSIDNAQAYRTHMLRSIESALGGSSSRKKHADYYF
jgi:hypothetical protein